MDQHLLSIILFTPLAGLAILLLLPGKSKDLIRVWANVAGFAGFLISLPLLSRFRNYVQFHVYSFEIADLMRVNLPMATQQLVFWAFFIGFAIKVPMFPFHTWLPDAHVEAPTAGSVILAAVLLKMGTYGFLRFSLPLLPQASVDQKIVQVLAILSIIGIIYGALVSLMQADWKKLVAYLLWLYQRTMLGQVTNGKNLTIPDMSLREIATFVPLIAWAIWIGIYPKPYFEILQRPVTEIVERVRPGYFGGTIRNAELRPLAPGPGSLAPARGGSR